MTASFGKSHAKAGPAAPMTRPAETIVAKRMCIPRRKAMERPVIRLAVSLLKKRARVRNLAHGSETVLGPRRILEFGA
jgi:hypothetical protein